MRFFCGNTWTAVEDATEEDRRALSGFLTIAQKGARWSPAFKRGGWDGKIHLYNDRRNRFPSGLVRMARDFMADRGVHVGVIDGRLKPVEAAKVRTDWLYDTQTPAVEACLRRTRGVVQAPTGSGKTEMFVSMGTLDIPWLVIVDTKDLMHQAAERFESRTEERAGRIGDGVWDERRFTVATFQSLLRAMHTPRYANLVARIRGMCVDEAHGLPGPKFYLVAMSMVNAYYRLGFSATPMCRADENELKMVAALGPVLHKIDPMALAAVGQWAVPQVWFADFEHEAHKGKNFKAVYEDAVVRNDARNALVVDLAMRGRGRPTLVFFRSIAHGHKLLEMLRAQGVSVDLAEGKTPVDRRRDLVQRLQCRDIEILVCSKIFNKGIDIPEASYGVNAAGGDSDIDAIQKLGRLTRGPNQVPGKTTCEYLDIRDRGQKWLSTHAKSRMRVYAEYGIMPKKVPDRDVQVMAFG